MTRFLDASIGLLGLGALTVALGSFAAVQNWFAKEQSLIVVSFSLAALGPVPNDPSNHVANDPQAVELGRYIFSDKKVSDDGTISCATCH